MKSVIFLTTATSATGSIQRIAKTILKKKVTYVNYSSQINKLPRDEMLASVPPEEGHFLLYNHPPAFSTSLDLSKYRTIVNFRDPRDRICNLYHWQLVHATPETPEARAARISQVKEMGIDAWVEQRCKSISNLRYYENAVWVPENAPASACAVLTYARLCCDFDSFIDKLSAFLGEELDADSRAALEPERVDNLEANKSWVGNRWSGSDTYPGRYKRELDSRRIDIVTKFFAPVLRRMAKADPDYAEQYLEGLN